ncbi:MAG: ABC transporter permease [Clostridia bacterium]|nr:ABC transporter permease [Clostridia bacterium]
MDEAFQSAVVKAIGRLEDKTADFNYGGDTYTVTLKRKNTYSITRSSPEITYAGEPLGDAFEEAVTRVIEAGGAGFNFNGDNYHIRNLGDSYSIYAEGDSDIALVASTFVFDLVDNTMAISDEFKSEALLALYDGGTFDYNGAKYTVVQKGDDIVITDKKGKEVAQLNTYSVRRYSGQDTLDLDFKDSVIAVIENMLASNQTKATFNHKLPAMDEKANYVYDKDGNLTYDDTELTITRTPTQYVVNCEQTTYLIDIHSAPTKDHWLGTDGDGMDILARAMYGGRISLMVSFVVVILEMILGIIMGGIAGFFGGIVDTVIMRLVDIFYCIPSMPILIITGAFFDAMKMNAYVRLVYLMAILGILGWAGVARLVRGQILSLREQEFMVAEESTGMRAGKRIFRHLVPNVMPQLIVSATMGLGSVIITESTLSFLGLGVKHPLATWGNMINSVTGSSEDMIKYTYIWIPIGMLICLTVIAFNFVGDGLRDAFDPKMKQ